ncbi:hypothetical protein [Mycobacterium sherrisii]|uniref:hypothetical protein n=1 Tax=Mycobacterium sherrisii TaxID=243061 RepID=UPI000A14D697|nr:hypothetical protein [Mycobacterium sherrisii]MCV7030802.1 hypothetical protein [Mycobacterium sherrisii]
MTTTNNLRPDVPDVPLPAGALWVDGWENLGQPDDYRSFGYRHCMIPADDGSQERLFGRRARV